RGRCWAASTPGARAATRWTRRRASRSRRQLRWYPDLQSLRRRAEPVAVRRASARSGRRTLDSRWRRRSNSPRCIGIAVVPAWVERAGPCSGYGVTACVGEEVNTLGLAGYAVRFVSCTDVHCEVASRRRATVHLGAGARCTAAPVPLSSLACEHCSHGQGDKDSEPWHLLSPPASWGLSSRLLQLSIGQTLALQALG